jgi:hypothetical protein
MKWLRITCSIFYLWTLAIYNAYGAHPLLFTDAVPVVQGPHFVPTAAVTCTHMTPFTISKNGLEIATRRVTWGT